VRDACLVIRRRKSDPVLAAFWVGGGVDARELRAQLRTRLPEYMIPAEFIQLPSLPYTASGKVDRARLQELDAPASDGDGFTPPQTSLETQILTVWREALGRDGIGIHQNFFDVGGHSLLVLRVYNSLRDLSGRQLKVMDMFRYPTVAALARYLSSHDAEGGEDKANTGTAGRRSELRTSRRRRLRARAHPAGSGS
jgi:hypothetical protein